MGNSSESPFELLPSSLAFNGTDVTTKNGVSVDRVLSIDRTVGQRVPIDVSEEIFEFGPADENLKFTS